MEHEEGRPSSQEITLRDLGVALATRKLLISACGLLLMALALGGSYLVTPVFKSDVLLAPVRDEDMLGGGKSSGSGALGGLATLAGIAPDQGSTQESIATLKSRQLTIGFIRDNNLLPLLYDTKWDKAAGRWKVADPDKQPTLWDAERYFSKNVRTVTEDKKTGLVTLLISWRDPTQAAQWANELVSRANALLRSKAIERSTRNLQFLQQQLEKTSVLEVRQSIDHLIENELKTLTLAEGGGEYAFKIVDPAIVPRRRAAPDRTLFSLGGLLFGLALGIGIGLFTRKGRRDGPADGSR